MKRKIIQISSWGISYSHTNVIHDELYALCNDGTVWVKAHDSGRDCEWDRLSDIPQDSDPEEEI